jgi:hypothetical protein
MPEQGLPQQAKSAHPFEDKWMVATMPKDGGLDSTLAMLADPYRYVSSQ